jgi:hypothetical protein
MIAAANVTFRRMTPTSGSIAPQECIGTFCVGRV